MFELPPTAAEVGESPERLKRKTLSNSTAITGAERQENDRESRAISRQYLCTVLLSWKPFTATCELLVIFCSSSLLWVWSLFAEALAMPTSSEMREVFFLFFKDLVMVICAEVNSRFPCFGSCSSYREYNKVDPNKSSLPSEQKWPAPDMACFCFVLAIPFSPWDRVQKFFRLYFCWLWTEKTKLSYFPLYNHNFPSPL